MDEQKNLIYNSALQDIVRSWKYYSGLAIAILIISETIRKFNLHLDGVPAFVLNSESLITLFSYQIVAIFVVISFLVHVIFLKIEERVVDKGDGSRIVNIMRRGFAWFIPILVVINILFGIITTEFSPKEKMELIYINRTYKVYSNGVESSVYFIEKNEILVSCKVSLLGDECFEKDILKEEESYILR